MTKETILQSPDILEGIVKDSPELLGRITWDRYGSIVIYGSVEDGAQDDDLLVWGPDAHLQTLADKLLDLGFEPDGAYDGVEAEFTSLRRDYNNIVLCKSLDAYNKYVLAARVTKDLELYNKPQRIMVYHAITKGEWLDPREDERELHVRGLVRNNPFFIRDPLPVEAAVPDPLDADAVFRAVRVRN